MMTKFSNGYLKKDRVWFVHECKTPGWEVMLCTDGGGDTYLGEVAYAYMRKTGIWPDLKSVNPPKEIADTGVV